MHFPVQNTPRVGQEDAPAREPGFQNGSIFQSSTCLGYLAGSQLLTSKCWQATILVYNRHSETVARNTEAMTQLAKAGNSNQDLMLSISRATMRDSGTMKLIAIITMVYLPATLITVRIESVLYCRSNRR